MKRVPLVDQTGPTPKKIGWAEADENGVIVGAMMIEDPEFARKLATGMGPLSITPEMDDDEDLSDAGHASR